MVVVEKFSLDSGIKGNAERFEKALLEQCLADQYQTSLDNESKGRLLDLLRLPGFLGLIFSLSSLGALIIFLVISIITKVYLFTFLVILIILVMLLGVAGESILYLLDRDRRKQQQLLLTKEAVSARKEILDNEAYHLAWVLMLRAEAFNRNLDALTGTENEDWNEWAAEHMTRRYQEIVEEIKASSFYRAPVRDLALSCAIDRLRHYLLLSPGDCRRLIAIL